MRMSIKVKRNKEIFKIFVPFIFFHGLIGAIHTYFPTVLSCPKPSSVTLYAPNPLIGTQRVPSGTSSSEARIVYSVLPKPEDKTKVNNKTIETNNNFFI